MMKKLICVLLAVLLLLSLTVPAFAVDGTAKQLQFRADGTFRILNICDIQDTYPMCQTTQAFLEETLASLKPDLVILGGDNCVAPAEVKAEAIKALCDLFVNSGTYFTLVFGNHDDEQGVDKETLLGYYQQYGGDWCLAYDAQPALFGVGTHNLPIRSADGSKVAFNLYMFDSNTYSYDADGNRLGYDAVHADQIDWYKATSAALAAENGGKVVPAMAFQHIVVQEAYDALFYRAPQSGGDLTNDFDGVSYTYLPKVAAIRDGFLFEAPCPGYYNYGQLDAMAETGDVVAVFSGHDHTNSYTLNLKGINVTNTAGCTYHSYGSTLNRGCRVIDLNEADPAAYQTYTYTMAEQALQPGSTLTEYGDLSAAQARLALIGGKLLSALMSVLRVVFFFAK